MQENTENNKILFVDHQILVYRQCFKLCFSKQTQNNSFSRVICEKLRGPPIRVDVLRNLENFIIMNIIYYWGTYKCRLQKNNLQIDKVYSTNKIISYHLIEILYLKQIKIFVKYRYILFYFNNKLVRKIRREKNLILVGFNILKVFQYQSVHIKDIEVDISKRFQNILIQINDAQTQIKEIRLYTDFIVFFTLGTYQQIFVTDKNCLNTPQGYYCKLYSDKINYNFLDFCRYQEKYFVLISIKNESVRLHQIDGGIISNNNLVCMIYNTNQCRFFDGYIYYLEFNKGIKRMEIPFQ